MLTRNGLVITGSPEIKKELTVRPKENVLGFQPASFKVWRKTSDGRMVVPRYFQLGEGSEAPRDVRAPPRPCRTWNFVGKLRDATRQNDAFAQGLKAFESTGGGVLSLPPGFGKCLGKDTPIMMADGTIRKVQDITTGEKIMGDDSTPRTVLSTCQGREQLYKVVPVKGDPYIVNESHILSLYSCDTGEIRDMAVLDYVNASNWAKSRLKGYRVPVHFDEKPVPLDPYMIGYWLGDGSSNSPVITSQEGTVLKYFNENLSKYDLYSSWISKYDYRIKGARPNFFYKTLQELNVLGNKHIPDIYKLNARQVQLQVLAGILDADGSRIQGGWEFIQKNEKLFDDVVFLARSLGFACYKSKCTKTCTNSAKGRVSGTYYRCSITGSGLEDVPCKVLRKRHFESRRQLKNVLHVGISVEKIEVGDYYGFEIDGNHRFVLGDFTVTHNTTVALAFATHLKVQTMIVVHKEFLANQWRDRINQFCPGASIGRVQGDTFDVEGKDFVIAMIQTMCQREFPVDAFDTFGLLIVDEAHHIGAPAFSQFMFKICPKFTLGLTATPERKDGLTRLLYWFLGPEFFRVERTAQKTTQVRVLNYTCDAFKEAPPITRFGKLNMAGLVTVLTELEDRNAMILDVIEEALLDDRKVLVLSDRRDHCFYFKNKLGDLAGLYIGGMGEAELAESAKARVVVATFQLAQEGLDIPELDTCILSTPKSDITQSIGRIMRETPGKRNSPLIIDVLDQWSVCWSMHAKRKAVYKAGGFDIEGQSTPSEDPSPLKKGQCLFIS